MDKPESKREAHLIYRVEFRSEQGDPVDFGYFTTLEYARRATKAWAKDPGTNGKRRYFDDKWYFIIWQEGIDTMDIFTDQVEYYDWWGDQIPPAYQRTGWEYGRDYKPHMVVDSKDGCELCRDDHARIVKETIEEFGLKPEDL